MMKVTEKIRCIKINKYFFRKEPEGPIFKYKQFCMRRKTCKTESVVITMKTLKNQDIV